MADVQVEDGYTRIANILLEKIASSKLNGCQNAIVLLVWRYTYGFNRKEHDLSAGFIATATGYNKRQIEREISVLVSRRILNQKVINGVSRTLAFNKDYESWTPGKLTDGEKADGKEADGPPADKPTVTPGKLADQEIHSFKDNFKETQEEEEPRTALEAYTYSFKKFFYTGHIQGYVTELLRRGFTDAFIREVFLEMGARGINADERYMRKLAEDWITNGIYTRIEAERRREQKKNPSEREAELQQQRAEERKNKVIEMPDLKPDPILMDRAAGFDD